MALTHLDAKGAMHMVDVSHKESTVRVARAEALLTMSAAARRALKTGTAKKGDVLAAARLAGIMAAKRTADLIPMCHPLALSRVHIDLKPTRNGVHIQALVSCTGPTGVEMEALTAASVAALTLYDMLKSVDRTMVIERVQLVEKRGGKSGTYRRKR